MATPLSPHFSLEELIHSDTAVKFKLDNSPDATVLENLKRTAEMMELVRSALGDKPIKINSGYRSDAVNRAVGGSTTSAHSFGHAIDFVCPSFGTPFQVCQRLIEAGILYDQLIHEYGRWTHISFDPRMRRSPLTIASSKQGYLPGIREIALT